MKSNLEANNDVTWLSFHGGWGRRTTDARIFASCRRRQRPVTCRCRLSFGQGSLKMPEWKRMAVRVAEARRDIALAMLQAVCALCIGAAVAVLHSPTARAQAETPAA